MKQKIEFASHPANLSLMRSFIRHFLEPLSCPETDADLIVLGLDEACSNIIRHAYKDEETHLITLSCEKREDSIVFRLRDFGEQGDPERLQGRPIEMVRPGGLGVHLIRKAFDEVDYILKKKGTELVLKKKLTADA